jgi:glycosyltransferase involved in cell wall biosynthesis
MALIPNSCLVCAFPAQSGLGRSARNLLRLGFFDEAAFLKFYRHDSEAGYSRVVRSRWSLFGGAGALASRYLPSSWKEYLARFDFVHFQSPHFFHFARLPRGASGMIHDTFFFDRAGKEDYPRGAEFYFRHEFEFLGELRGIVTNSVATERDLLADYPNPRSRVIHLWTDPEFRPRDKLEARRELGLPPEKKILLSVSSENRLKNLELLPPMLNELGPEFLLVRIGSSESIRSRFRGPVLTFPSVPDGPYARYFNAADMVLLPSRKEGFGYPLIEAVNSGIPVLASSIPVFRELLGDDYPYLLDPDDPVKWVAAAREVAGTDPQSGAHLASYRRIGDHYREDRGRKEFEEFFRSAGVL